MVRIQLKKHDRNYTEVMSALTSDERVQKALKLNRHQVSINGTRDFIDFIQGEERMGHQVSRVIFNEEDKLIGVITLKGIDRKRGIAHIGTWLGADYWGKGYNELAKEEMFKYAFETLQLNRVFAGARIANERSLAAQKKLPYVRFDVGAQFPEELEKIEQETNEKCILNVVEKDDFMNYLAKEYGQYKVKVEA